MKEGGVPSRQTIHNLVNKLRSTGLLTDKKRKHRCPVLAEEKQDNIRDSLEHTPRKSLKLECESLVQEG
jgi:transposase